MTGFDGGISRRRGAKMNLDELIASYDPAEVEFMKRLNDEERQNNDRFSFIPTEEECEKILLSKSEVTK